MADLLLVHFALIPGPVRKERQFCLPDDFSGLDFTIPSRVRPVFPRFFEFLRHGQTAVRGSAKCSTRPGQSKKFQHFSSLTSRCNVKGKISGGI